MDNRRLRSIIFKLRHRLSNNDRKRLQFYLGNHILQRIQDYPTIAGTLNLIGSLLDKNDINDKDLSYLINAFDEIHCCDAANFLREYRNQNRANPSIHNLSKSMPPLFWNHPQSISRRCDDKNYNEATIRHKMKLLEKCILFFVLLFMVINTELLFFSLWNNIQFRQIEEENLQFMKMIKAIKTKQNENAVNLNQSESKLENLGILISTHIRAGSSENSGS
ncbi:hypothetical protein I4U23_016386 [Adineta vaga]|nr:hypothetical protein I4U23_016386 [Adineta vaga]